MVDVGRLLIFAGIALVVLGVVFLLAGRTPFLGQLPGDLRLQFDGVSCFIPLATSLLISIVLSLLLTLLVNLLQRR